VAIRMVIYGDGDGMAWRGAAFNFKVVGGIIMLYHHNKMMFVGDIFHSIIVDKIAS